MNPLLVYNEAGAKVVLGRGYYFGACLEQYQYLREELLVRLFSCPELVDSIDGPLAGDSCLSSAVDASVLGQPYLTLALASAQESASSRHINRERSLSTVN